MEPRLGIRREDKSEWERRAPLAPKHVQALKEQGITTVIQPSPIRVFTDDEYRQAGAIVDEDLSGCNLIVAVKEIPTKLLEEGKSYLYFSHTIKGQPYNMPMLRRLLELRCTLLDHEKITDEQGRRLVLFSYHAGLAGMLDSLWSLGQRLKYEGFETPFSAIKMAYEYGTLATAEAHLREIAEVLAKDGLPKKLGPVVVGLSGYGNVSRGAQRILDLLRPVDVSPEELASTPEAGKLYKVVFKEEHMVAPKDSSEAFELQTYFDHPERFRSTFAGHLDHLTMLVNCIYWEERYPRLVTNERLRELYAEGATPRLRVIGDISCDIDGAIQATVKPTQPDNPVYVYDAVAEKALDGVEGRGPVIMAVDNLPCELSKEATESFGDALTPLLPGSARADYEKSFDELDLPAPMKRAVIAHQGELTPTFRYIEEFLR